MIQNSALEKSVTEKDKKLWCQTMMIILEVAKYLEDYYPKKYEVSYECHSICRALVMLIPDLRVVDGHFVGLEAVKVDGGCNFKIRCCSHSWLLTPDGAIIDPYPVGFITTNPILIGPRGEYTAYGQQFYVADTAVTNRVINRSVRRKSVVLFHFMKEWQAFSK